MKRYSKQREVIMKSLKARCDHPTADMLYWDLKKELPEIGIATVYRNLAELYASGEILKITTKKGGPDRFDGNIEPHLHFACEKCEKVYDIFPEHTLYQSLQRNFRKLADTIHADCTNTSIVLYGVCESCEKNNKEEEKNESLCM